MFIHSSNYSRLCYYASMYLQRDIHAFWPLIATIVNVHDKLHDLLPLYNYTNYSCLRRYQNLSLCGFLFMTNYSIYLAFCDLIVHSILFFCAYKTALSMIMGELILKRNYLHILEEEEEEEDSRLV